MYKWNATILDDNEVHARRVAALIDISGSSVLVVGANTGADCRYFSEWGAEEVHGLDVAPNAGSDYQANEVSYFCMPANAMRLPGNYYDVVYCVSTMSMYLTSWLRSKKWSEWQRPGG